ncbi:MAG: hypothetical protein ABI867_20265, partial [Kofleriaceae bacterium]
PSRAAVKIPVVSPVCTSDESGLPATTTARVTTTDSESPAQYRIAIRGASRALSSWTEPVPLLVVDADGDGASELVYAATDDGGLTITAEELAGSFRAFFSESH